MTRMAAIDGRSACTFAIEPRPFGARKLADTLRLIMLMLPERQKAEADLRPLPRARDPKSAGRRARPGRAAAIGADDCCIVAAHQDFVRTHPVATKRALRAIMKATHFCAVEPERAARMVADKGYRYDYSLQTMKEIAYARWRDYDAEDTVRFYALRLHESGMIKSTPSKIIAQGTDWRFFHELKRELKG